jgi:hypothetical protein
VDIHFLDVSSSVYLFLPVMALYGVYCFYGVRFKDYHNYDEHPESEMLDAIIGFIIFGVMIGIFIKVTDRHGW